MCVTSPSRLHRITDLQQARENPELTLLALALHGIDYGVPDAGAAQLRAGDVAASFLDSPLLVKYLRTLANPL